MYTWDRNFIKTFKDKHQIVYVYEGGDSRLIEIMRKDVLVVQNTGQRMETDLCIYSSIYQGAHRIKARKYYQILHADVNHWKINYQPIDIDKHIAVGQGVADSFKEHQHLKAEIIPNLIEKIEPKKVLRLLTASRIAEGKGFERMIEMAKKLKNSGMSWTWEIYGPGARSYVDKMQYKTINIDNVQWMGSRIDIQDYMSSVDYVVQLSDNEGFCYSVAEALQIGTPVIVTRWQGVEQMVKDGENGYVLDMDLSNLDIDKLYNFIPKNVKLEVTNSLLLWDKLLDF